MMQPLRSDGKSLSSVRGSHCGVETYESCGDQYRQIELAEHGFGYGNHARRFRYRSDVSITQGRQGSETEIHEVDSVSRAKALIGTLLKALGLKK
jgi:hypothetical protein